MDKSTRQIGSLLTALNDAARYQLSGDTLGADLALRDALCHAANLAEDAARGTLDLNEREAFRSQAALAMVHMKQLPR